MKINITFKDPDVVGDAIQDAAKEQLAAISELSAEERDSLFDHRREKLQDLLGEFFQYGEYVTIEVDTDARTARVVPVRETRS